MKDLGKECNRMPDRSRCLKIKEKGECPAEVYGRKCLNRHRFGNDVVVWRKIKTIETSCQV